MEMETLRFRGVEGRRGEARGGGWNQCLHCDKASKQKYQIEEKSLWLGMDRR